MEARETGLSQRVVVVTGGAAGIGQATAKALAAEGCRVAVWDGNLRGEEVAQECAASGGEVLPGGCDSSSSGGEGVG